MKTTNDLYDFCRCFVKDHENVLREAGVYERILGYIRSRNLAALCTCSAIEVDRAKHSIDLVRCLKQVEALFKKNREFSNPDVCSDAAAFAFNKAERLCSITNRRLDWYHTQRDRLDPDLDLYLSRSERYIKRVLGNHARFLDRLPSLIRVTSGATSTRPRSKSLPQLKLTMRPASTDGASLYLRPLYRYYGYEAPRCRLTNENRVTLVPKNWKTDRTIACEPTGNLPLQLAFDSWTKDRLRLWNIDLADQTRNQELAREGSITDQLATVDFSMASDTLSYNTVAWLLPHEWFVFLARVRCSNYNGVFGEGRYAKFSSMGNGATFTLETLVFASIAYAVGSKRFSVYGDDVIIESELYEPFVRVAKFLGFQINHDKSFRAGPFRESCGADWYEGTNITPQYVRHLDKRKSFQCHNVNILVAASKPFGHAWSFLRDFVHAEKLNICPFTYNTLEGIHVPAHDAYKLKLIRKRHWILQYKAYRYKTEQLSFVDSRGLTLWYLRSCNLLSSSTVHFDPGNEALVKERITSRVPALTGKYRKQWVCWNPPALVVPAHLYGWADFLYLNDVSQRRKEDQGQ